jgi:DHA1 family tetracycline resistance protein-like MFS transporter
LPLPLFIIFVTLVIDFVGIGIAFPIMPKLVAEITGGTVAETSVTYGLLIALYSLMQFIFSPLMGALSDRYGRRPIILSSLAGLTLDYVILVYAPSLAILALARIVGGVLSASFSTAAAYIADITPPEKRAQNFAVLGLAIGVGFIIGPALGGYLGDVNPRLPFAVAAGICLLDIAFTYFFLPESLKPENRKEFSLRRANPIGALMVMRRYPGVVSLATILLFSTFAERMLESIWALYSGYRFSWTPKEIGWSFAAVGVLFLISQGFVVRRTVPAFGERKVLLFGLAVATLCFVGYAFSSQGWMVYALMVVHILGWGGVQPAVQALASRAVPANEQGLLQGSLTSMTMLTSIAAAPVGGSLFAYFIGGSAPVVLPGAPFLVGAVLFAFGLAIAFRNAPKAAS